MPTFKDSAGREWLVEITAGSLRRAKSEGVALPQAIGPKFNEFISDPLQVVASLWILCDPGKKGLSEEQFADLFDGPALQAASVALTEAVINFSLPPATAQAAKVDLSRRVQKKAAQMTAAISSAGATESPDTSE